MFLTIHLFKAFKISAFELFYGSKLTYIKLGFFFSLPTYTTQQYSFFWNWPLQLLAPGHTDNIWIYFKANVQPLLVVLS